MPALFSDGEEDGGLFGGNADDIFEAASPPKVINVDISFLSTVTPCKGQYWGKLFFSTLRMPFYSFISLFLLTKAVTPQQLEANS